ncbi:heavy metal translocating P-type ATPase [Enemella dayhoffiae]|uniref:Cation-transporting P-type ATPase B n=1 Tax=Enemella dayhoffiae TaxID=2016507 RepID=A0A255HFD8_9ACTN|nr:heavy metal translocating P-type ATPase [Enemella dayhoffiae]OYO25114.1 heavy metal translocating P-type ATPase [Enemella dayhoffiae]
MTTQTRQRPQTIELDIQGMTCASCAARIEKKLNRVDGVSASVNFATEKAVINSSGDHGPQELIKVVEATGYHATLPTDRAAEPPDDAVAALREKLVISALLSFPVILLAMVPPLQFNGWQWLSLGLATPVVLWAASGFHRAALLNARHRAATMDTLISMGSLAAYAWSVVALIFGSAGHPGMTHGFSWRLERGDGLGNIYLEAACGIVTFILAGRFFEARAKRRAGEAVRALLTLGASDVAVLRDGVEHRVPIDQLAVGDEFVVRPGEKVATDGIVSSGRTSVDNALVTGESVPVEVGPGDEVIGASLNTDGRIVVRATRVGQDTQLAQIARLVESAQAGKAQVQRLADRISAVFVPIVIGLSVVTLAVWLLLGAGTAFAFTAAVSVLIIACPCALGLATPTALLVGTGRGAQLGIVIKGPEVLEDTRRVDTVVLDKTGTVTTGEMAVVGVRPVAGLGEAELLRLAAAVEEGSEHPIARAIVQGFDRLSQRESGKAPEATDFRNLPGVGAEATVEGRRIGIGRASMITGDLPDELRAAFDEARSAGRTAVLVSADGAPVGVIEVADGVRPTSAEALSRLVALGLRPVLLTGDSAAAAHRVAAEVGIDEVIAEVLPVDKVEAVRRLQADGRRVAMIGDGVNDAAALATADLGIAMGTGTDAAIEASDLTLVHGDLLLAADAIRLSRATLRTIRVNLFWAFAYNVAAIPLAALGFLNPMLAGAAMALSSVFVVSNSLRLRRFRAYAR